LVLLRDGSVDLSDPLAVAAAAEQKQTLAQIAAAAAVAAGGDNGDDIGGGGGEDSGDEGLRGSVRRVSASFGGDAMGARALEELIDGLDEDLPEVEEVSRLRWWF
jgi:hypothetical protein